MAVQTQIQVRRGTAATWTSTNPTLAAGEIGFETDTGKMKIGDGASVWTGLNYIGAANSIAYVYVATAGQTTFSGADSNSLTLAYTVGAEQVYLNGALLVRGSDYTATNGTSIVLATGALVSDILTVIAAGTFTVANTYTQAQADAAFVAKNGYFAAGKNAIINGAFNVWQRGTSFTPTPGGGVIYTTDRFNTYNNGTGALTISQQALTPGSISGYESPYFLQAALASVGTTTGWNWVQPIENVQTFAGQTVTLSFWAKSTNSATTTITFSQKFGSGGSSQVDTNSSAITLTSTWTRYTATVTLPSISGKTIGTGSSLTLTWNMGATVSTYGFWGVQLEAGSVATPFTTATGTLQGELAACQRYYYRITGNTMTGSAFTNSNVEADAAMLLPVTMRTTPTTLDYSSVVFRNYASSTFPITAGTLVLYAPLTNSQNAYLYGTIVGGTAGQVGTFTGIYIGIGAEL